MNQIEEHALRAIEDAITSTKPNGHKPPSVLSNVDKINEFAGEAISRSGEELADYIEKSGEEVIQLAEQYRAESQDLAIKLRELYKDETVRLNHFLKKIQGLRDTMAEAKERFTGE